MQFYKYSGIISDPKWSKEFNEFGLTGKAIRAIAMKSSSFNQGLHKKAFYFVSDASEKVITIGILIKELRSPEKQAGSFARAIGFTMKDIVLEEITFSSFRDLLSRADRRDFINDDDTVLEEFDLNRLIGYRGIDFEEGLIEDHEKEDVYETARKFLSNETLLPELDRIYAAKTRYAASGHPVHYMIQTDDEEIRKGMYRLLAEALYANGRISSRRYSCLSFKPGSGFSRTSLECLYKSSFGGVVIAEYQAGDDTEDDHASGIRETVKDICGIMQKYRNQVLTVFCLPRSCAASRSYIYEYLGNTGIIELKEEFAYAKRAEEFLKMLASEVHIRTDKALFSAIETEKGYLAPELRDLFDSWYANKLKTKIYPQYSGITSAKREAAKTDPTGSAYEELTAMPGLAEAKKVIGQALDYYKAQRLFADKGMSEARPAMHMVFTGNPGTAKTSAARLFARIMRENGLLSKGNLIEVGRSDLVGKYVGWTAPTIKNKFREAKGGVLFIDEAYSLVDDRSGSYGDEAINTIVQEMENHREDVIVIFAGYPAEMEKFLQKNPGLRSRIAFHVPFADYSTEELIKIAGVIASQKGLCLSENAEEKLRPVFDRAKENADFGNGRYVRNIIEKARMAQASRLLSMDVDAVTAEDVRTILAGDIEIPEEHVHEKHAFGFVA